MVLKTSKALVLFGLSALVSANSYGFTVPYAPQAPIIDGINDEPVWEKAQWRTMDEVIIGAPPSAADFSARYRLVWDEQALYLQVELLDDVLFDAHPDPLKAYWDDDALEIFIDEDASGGEHQFNHNAFAYHVALDGNVADLAPNKQPALYNHHVVSRWQRSASSPYTITWEAAIYLYKDDYQDQKDNPTQPLFAGKKVGFMLAYCDNDGSPNRENFVGSTKIEAVDGDRNRGWIDAGVFDKIVLQKP